MIHVAAITDEFSPTLKTALDAMQELGVKGVELRIVDGRNVVELSPGELDAVRADIEARGMTILSIASPVLKCVLPDAPEIDARLQHDVFGSAYTIDDQPRLAERAFEAAKRTGAGIVRVFSYWRTVNPSACLDRVVAALRELGDQASACGVTVGVENEHACNIGTGAELGALLRALEHPRIAGIWDPANALILDEKAYPDGYRQIPARRIAHVHAKDCVVQNHTPTWGPVGEMSVGWREQIRALEQDGYRGWVSLETHWRGPSGDDKMEASRICARNLIRLTSGA
jgi:sugar phosphate isomerase/epimerase